MSDKLGKSLDDIVKSRQNGRTKGRVNTRRTKTATAVVGGVTKTTRAARASAKQTPKAAPIATIPAIGNSKIIVSGLPSDVTEVQIKDYFSKTIGPVKSVFLVYGPNGQSRGQASILFTQATSAHEAASKLNGVKVDNRSMKIEVVLGANEAPVPVVKGLGDRIESTRQRQQPKSAAVAKPLPKPATAANGRRSAKPAPGNKPGAKGRGANRPKRKTQEELDAEMTDYFVPKDAENSGAATAAAPAAAAVGGDASMDDQIM